MLFQKIVHRIMLTTLPFFQNVPFRLQPGSTYLNFRLNDAQVADLSGFLKMSNTCGMPLNIVPIKLLRDDQHPHYYVSVNIYKVESPLFGVHRPATRFEINTYVEDSNGNKGTVILDYFTDTLSMDPVHVFKRKTNLVFLHPQWLFSKVFDERRINFHFESDTKGKKSQMSDELLLFTDKIFYKNGVYDKLFYDSQFALAEVKMQHIKSFYFRWRTKDICMVFSQPEELHSSFHFETELPFLCSMWHNINDF